MTRLPNPEARMIIALILGVTIYGFAMGTTYPLLGLLLSDQVSGALIGINTAATGLGLMTGVVLLPGLGRRLGAGPTALAGVGLLAAALVALAFLRDFWPVFAARLVLGCGAGLMFIVAETELNAAAAPERRGRIMGVYTAASALGFVLGPAMIALMPDRPAALLLGCAAIALMALIPFAVVARPVSRAVAPGSVRHILPAIAAFPLAFGFLFIASMVDAVAISLMPVIMLDRDFDVSQAVLLATVFHVGLVIGQPLIGLALDRAGRRRTVLGCCGLSLACTLPLISGSGMGFWPVAGLMLVWGGANYGLYTAALALIGDRFQAEKLTAAIAALAAVYALAAIIGPAVAGGMMTVLGAQGLFGAVAVVYLAALCGGVWLFRPVEPGWQKQTR
ncbi:MFS transporter [Mesorhizobium sp.]|uniref:MFS transporter n=1 Tax=Mesorhizobium sp. TaxID=1871066 RepID=UPI000FE5068F|nr:MFS transporter [Mesorhizobium sp.]RWI34076.1 MAG: MFS transporter [Mesorhizobium sp.]RWI63605.1 MAG: MFS transporter [Mesorhizobium sp.]RWJ25296.1 MAG: MFS transporter [Mesorhizobium sp.]TIQ70064.1 MAG: MFS transporter [Mesorhizobium sp.]